MGSGYYLGDYVMREAFRTAKTLKEAAFLAIRAFTAAKSYDAYCGGETQFMSVLDGGGLSVEVPYDISISESFILEFEEASRKLLSAMADPHLSDADFKIRTALFVAEMERLRAFWQERGDEYMYDIFAKLSRGKGH